MTLGGCSWSKKEAKNDGSLRVQIPFVTNGEYGLRVVELLTLKNLPQLQGLAANFLIDPDSASGRLKGRLPSIRYIRDTEGVIVPTDDLSLQLLTVYAHFEKLKSLDDQSGVGENLHWPQTVAVNAQFNSNDGMVENNALYSGQYDALLFVPYTQSSLPLMANGGVIGHEHFHAIFQKMLIGPLKSKYPENNRPTVHERLSGADGIVEDSALRDKYHAVLMRGINEGLADVWAWVYTGDTVFVGRSLPQEKLRRALDVQVERFSDKAEIFNAVSRGEDPSYLLAMSYQHGTQLARSIQNFAKLYSGQKKIPLEQVRKMVGVAVIQSLSQMQKEFAQLKDTEFFTVSRAANIFSQQIKDLNSNQCFYFLKLMPGEDRASTQIGKNCSKLESSESGT